MSDRGFTLQQEQIVAELLGDMKRAAEVARRYRLAVVRGTASPLVVEAVFRFDVELYQWGCTPC